MIDLDNDPPEDIPLQVVENLKLLLKVKLANIKFTMIWHYHPGHSIGLLYGGDIKVIVYYDRDPIRYTLEVLCKPKFTTDNLDELIDELNVYTETRFVHPESYLELNELVMSLMDEGNYILKSQTSTSLLSCYSFIIVFQDSEWRQLNFRVMDEYTIRISHDNFLIRQIDLIDPITTQERLVDVIRSTIKKDFQYSKKGSYHAELRE